MIHGAAPTENVVESRVGYKQFSPPSCQTGRGHPPAVYRPLHVANEASQPLLSRQLVQGCPPALVRQSARQSSPAQRTEPA